MLHYLLSLLFNKFNYSIKSKYRVVIYRDKFGITFLDFKR